jgi:hypothetical protein
MLRPLEYTRLDGIVELLFAAKQDLETLEAVSPPDEEQTTTTVSKLATSELEAAREAAVRRIGEKLGVTFIRRGKAIRASSDGKIRLVCIASQRYSGPGGSANYWYGFTPSQKSFLEDASSGYVALVCGDSGKTYLAPREEIFGWLTDMLTTPSEPAMPDDIRHWHIYFNDYGDHVDLMRSGGGVICDLTRHTISNNSIDK